MRRDRLDVSGMIRALEDYLAATRPAPPPEPPRAKTEAEASLEKLLAELSKPKPPAPSQPEPVPVLDHPVPMELETSLEESLASDSKSESEPAEDNVSFLEDIVVPEPVRLDDDVQEAPKAPPIPRPGPSSTASSRDETLDNMPDRRPARTLLLAIAVVASLVPLILTRRPANVSVKAPAAAKAAPAPARPAAALPSDPQDRAIALVLAYRPSGGPVTAGEIFRSIAGDPIPADNWDIRAAQEERFVIRFVPYRGALGENYSYDFAVDARAGWVRPRPDTLERLRVDALGRMASRSDLQAFRQFLDLGR